MGAFKRLYVKFSPLSNCFSSKDTIVLEVSVSAPAPNPIHELLNHQWFPGEIHNVLAPVLVLHIYHRTEYVPIFHRKMGHMGDIAASDILRQWTQKKRIFFHRSKLLATVVHRLQKTNPKFKRFLQPKWIIKISAWNGRHKETMFDQTSVKSLWMLFSVSGQGKTPNWLCIWISWPGYARISSGI